MTDEHAGLYAISLNDWKYGVTKWAESGADENRVAVDRNTAPPGRKDLQPHLIPSSIIELEGRVIQRIAHALVPWRSRQRVFALARGI